MALDYDKLLEQHCQIVDLLSSEVDRTDDAAELTALLRNTGLALGNINKLRTLRKRDVPEEENDTTIDDLIANARQKAKEINGKK